MKGVHAALKDTGLEDCATIVLIGSHARDVASWRSDVDILVLCATIVLIGSHARDVASWRSDVDILVLSDDGARLSFPI